MPVLSRFYGMVIRMYFQQSEHNPPHIHVIYGDNVAAFDFVKNKIIEGYLPPKALSMVKEWCDNHRDELIDIWNTQEFKEIEPLN